MLINGLALISSHAQANVERVSKALTSNTLKWVVDYCNQNGIPLLVDLLDAKLKIFPKK
jgi:hypothetical protein